MEYRREIDGLRAVAVVPVILFHAGFDAFSGGFIGVDVFFVISGYLITSLILAEMRDGTFTLAGFYERRARRILPPLFVVMLACSVLAALWALPGDLKTISQGFVAVSLFASNILFWKQTAYFAPSAELNPLLHTWSLSVEEQYYILFPITLLLVWRLGRRWVTGIVLAALALSISLAQWGSTTHPSATFYMLPTRGWELLIGVLIALVGTKTSDAANTEKHKASQQLFSIGGLGLIVYAIVSFDRNTPFPGLNALIPTVGTALVIMCATPATVVGKLLGSKPLVGLGLISYSLYLWHQPLFAFARLRSLNEPRAVVLIALSCLAGVFAFLSWRFVEKPVRNRLLFKRPAVVAMGIVGTCLFMGIGLLGCIYPGVSRRVPQGVNALLEMKPTYLEMLIEGDCGTSSGCVEGSGSVEPQYAFWGDSHAEALAMELRKAFSRAEKSYVRYTIGGCPAAFNFKRKQGGDCASYATRVFDNIVTRNVSTVIVASRWQFYVNRCGFDNGEGGVEHEDHVIADVDDGFDVKPATHKQHVLRNYKTSILKLVATGKKIILIYPIPEVGWDVPEYLAKAKMFGEARRGDLTTSYVAYLRRNRETTDALDSIGEHQNLIRIRPERLLCNSYFEGRCAAQLNGDPLYFDDDHLSMAGARLVVDEVMKHIR